MRFALQGNLLLRLDPAYYLGNANPTDSVPIRNQGVKKDLAGKGGKGRKSLEAVPCVRPQLFPTNLLRRE